MTGKLATFACMGFIFGPTFGAAVGAFPSFTLGVIAFNAFTKVGWVCAVLNMTMFLGTWAGFREIGSPRLWRRQWWRRRRVCSSNVRQHACKAAIWGAPQ